MEELLQLAQLVDKNAEKKIDLLGNPANYSSKMNRLYEGLLSGKFKSDDEATNSLYEKGTNQMASYNKLKKRLYQRLLNTLLFIDAEKLRFNDYQTAYYLCYKEFAVLKIVVGRGARQLAVRIA